MSYPGKGPADFQSKGDWNARCSMCSFKRKASTLVRNWQGMWRCPEHNEPRHPQDYVRGIPDNPMPPWVQPGGQTYTQVCTLEGISSVADYAVADCAICDTPYLVEPTPTSVTFPTS